MFVYLPKGYTGDKPQGGVYDNDFNVAYWDGSKWVCPLFSNDYKSSTARTNGTDQIYLKYDVTAEKVDYQSSRALEAEQFYTVCLPYAPTQSLPTSSATYYKLKSVSGTDLTFTEVAEPEANVPYLVKTTAAATIDDLSTEVQLKATPDEMGVAADGYKMVGTLGALDKDQTAGKYILQADNKWQKTDTAIDGVTIPAFRAYIVAASALGARQLATQLAATTAVERIRTVAADGTETLYDLSGRRVASAQRKGLYIVNGKKVIK